jgi:glycosyltransferase involved in cell wall biosynthesis
MKYLLVGYSVESKWVSCKSIKKNLLQTYQNYKQLEFELFDYDLENIEQLGSRITTKKYSKIIFIDHRPNPALILNQLIKIVPIDQIPQIIIHIYGDFTYFAKDFHELNLAFKGHKISFIAASKAQQKLINFFLIEKNCAHFPFSINKDFYYFNQTFRNSFRKKYCIDDTQKVILYTGRLSLQKNIDLVIKEFELYKSKKKNNDKLFLAGPFDDFGARFMGGRCLEGHYFNKITSQIYNSPFKNDIILMGNLSEAELRDAYCGSDLYINYSLHHDEDFGIAPLEAHACNLPLLLTPWGGFNDFFANFCQLQLDQIGYSISSNHIEKAISTQRTNYCYPHIDLNPILKCENTFNGFNENLEKYFNFFSTDDFFLNRPNLNSIPSCDNYYFDVYSNYFTNKKIQTHSFQVNWIYEHLENNNHESAFNHQNGQQETYEKILPYSTSYFSSPPSDFFYFGQLGIIKKNELIIRSGKKSILEFKKLNNFNNFSGLYVDFFLHNECKLNNHYGAYQVLSHDNKNENFHEILISLCTFTKLNENQKLAIINKIEELKRLNPDLIIRILNPRNLIFNQRINDLEKLLKQYNYKFSICDWKEFRTITNLKHTYFFETFDWNIISDTFSRFSALSRGASTNLPQINIDQSNWKKVKIKELSPFHSVELYKLEQ